MTRFPVSENRTITLSNTKRALITVSKIVAPSFIAHYHEKTLEEMGPPPFDIVVDLHSLVSREAEREETVPIEHSTGSLQESEIGHNESDDVESRDSSDSESDSSDSDNESDPLHNKSPALIIQSCASAQNPVRQTTGPTSLGDDEFEQFMDADLDAYIALHQEGPDGATGSQHPLVQPAESTTP